MDYLVVSSLLFRLNLVLSVMISHVKFFMFNLSGSIPILYVLTQLVSLIDLT